MSNCCGYVIPKVCREFTKQVLRRLRKRGIVLFEGNGVVYDELKNIVELNSLSSFERDNKLYIIDERQIPKERHDESVVAKTDAA